MSLQITGQDINKIKADAIVCIADTDAIAPNDLDIDDFKEKKYSRLFYKRKKTGFSASGKAVLTSAGQSNAKYIIYVGKLSGEYRKNKEAALLRRCYDGALCLARKNRCKTVAFPLLTIGSHAFSRELQMQIAVDAFTDFLKKYEMEIILVISKEDSEKFVGRLVDEIDSYFNSVYETEKFFGEGNRLCKETITEGLLYEAETEEEHWSTQISQGEAEEELGPEMSHVASPEKSYIGDSVAESQKSYHSHTEPLFNLPLDDRIKEIYTDSFEKHLRKIINKKGLKNSEVYAAANISKQYFSKLLKGKVKPSKEKVLALAVGLRLNKDELVDFLSLAGYALSPISQTDVIVEYFIEQKDYNVIKIDIVLFDYGLDPLSRE